MYLVLFHQPRSRCILQCFNGLGQDFHLFLMTISKMSASHLPCFYNIVFKVWNMLTKERTGQAESAYWLQQEPILLGTKLDGEDNSQENCNRRRHHTEPDGDAAAPPDGRPLWPCCSTSMLRIVQKLLDHWKTKLSSLDRLLLTLIHKHGGRGGTIPSHFPGTGF